MVALLLLAAAIQLPSADMLLEASIAHHDPAGIWPPPVLRLELSETRPEGDDRKTSITLGEGGERFSLVWRTPGRVTAGRLEPGGCEWTLDGSTEIAPEIRAELKLTCERLTTLRDYYTYLWGLPMKLRDPGTRLDPIVSAGELGGQPVWVLRVTYDPEVGGDTWLFYLDQETSALRGYRFFHDEAAGDGELVLLEGEIEGSGLRLPRTRRWFTNAEGQHLGTDHLEAVGP